MGLGIVIFEKIFNKNKYLSQPVNYGCSVQFKWITYK